MISEIQHKITELKKQKDICILAHIFQNKDIAEIADFVGEAFEIAEYAEKVQNKNILVCGVRFTAENIKILSPEKNVYMSSLNAECTGVQQISEKLIMQMKEIEPDRTVVSYINTAAKIKALSDVCVTKSNSVKVFENLKSDKILFISDGNLGINIKKKFPQKDIRLVSTVCPVFEHTDSEEVKAEKCLCKSALLLSNIQCKDDIAKLSDYVGTSSGIVDFVGQSDNKEFIVCSEISVKELLQHKYSDKTFRLLSKSLICHDMKQTSLCDVFDVVKTIGDNDMYELKMSATEIKASLKCIENMRNIAKIN